MSKYFKFEIDLNVFVDDSVVFDGKTCHNSKKIINRSDRTTVHGSFNAGELTQFTDEQHAEMLLDVKNAAIEASKNYYRKLGLFTVKDRVCKKRQEIAYYLWEKAGKPEGRDKEFWDKAEKDAWKHWSNQPRTECKPVIVHKKKKPKKKKPNMQNDS